MNHRMDINQQIVRQLSLPFKPASRFSDPENHQGMTVYIRRDIFEAFKAKVGEVEMEPAIERLLQEWPRGNATTDATSPGEAEADR